MLWTFVIAYINLSPTNADELALPSAAIASSRLEAIADEKPS
ncbi:hypothetical protein [Nostoc sp.]